MSLTEQQQAVVDGVGRGESQDVRAVAGAGKTSTLETALRTHSAKLPKSTLAIAFNVATRDAFKKRFPDTVTCMTLNGLGHRALASGLGRLELNDSKAFEVAKAVAPKADIDVILDIKAGLNAARTRRLGTLRQRMAGVKGILEEELLQLAEDEFLGEAAVPFLVPALNRSIELATRDRIIDFQDQIYLPLALGLDFPHFDAVFGDETQDFSEDNADMVAKVKPKMATMIGDPAQSIYAFRGADPQSMNRLAKRFKLEPRRLSMCFRCPTSVLDKARQWVPDIMPRPSAPEGMVIELELDDIDWTQPATVLCRFNAPLFRQFYRLLRAGIPACMPGMKGDASILRVLNKAASRNLDTPIARVLDMLGAMELSNPRVADPASVIRILAENCSARTAQDVKNELDRVFAKDHARIRLSSIHKAKGLEWPRVVWLNAGASPRDWLGELTPDEDQQERNLCYVATTRAMETLIHTWE
jgi:DNA helicase-2/ATP-dependent DNA helicase PcrA